METTGKVIAILPLRSGTGKSGKQWRSQEFVIETDGQYPRKMCATLFNDKIETASLVMGNTYTVSFDIDAREVNGRWFGSITAYKVELVSTIADNRYNGNNGAPYQAQDGSYRQQPPKSAPVPQQPNMFPPQQSNADGNDDLPF